VRVPLTWENTDCQDQCSAAGRDTLKVKSTSARAGEGCAGEVHVGSEEEMDFLGIPGLLEADQVP
jgi:hypothetical protein